MRILTYSHDSVGLGHLRRSVTMARALVSASPHAQVLCLTGSPVPEVFPLPERCDLVKLPSIGKDEAGAYVSRRLDLTFGAVTELRSDLITATVRAFRPDVFLVDHSPCGPGGELLPVLRRLQHEGLRTRVVLGLRDVLDEPVAARRELRDNDAFEHMRQCYDDLFVYGDREVFDPLTEYGFPDDVARKALFTGAVVAPEAQMAAPLRRENDLRHVLVTTGGGEDGYELLRSATAALRGPLRSRDLRATIVAGPLLAEDAFRSLRLAVEREPRITLLRSSRDMQGLRMASDLVVGMGGYNTVYECLASGVRLLAVPRTAPRREQLVRCRRLQELAALDLVEPAQARDPHVLAAAIERSLARPALSVAGDEATGPLRCRGAQIAANLLLERRDRRHNPSVAARGARS